MVIKICITGKPILNLQVSIPKMFPRSIDRLPRCLLRWMNGWSGAHGSSTSTYMHSLHVRTSSDWACTLNTGSFFNQNTLVQSEISACWSNIWIVLTAMLPAELNGGSRRTVLYSVHHRRISWEFSQDCTVLRRCVRMYDSKMSTR